MSGSAVLERRATMASLAGMLMLLPPIPPATAQAGVASMARCQQLMDAFDRYYPRKGEGLRSSGSRLDRDIAEVECQKRRYAEGIRQREDALRRNRIAIPPEG
jgi:hypothetical protein